MDYTASVEFQMSLLLFIALGGYLIASRIGQSAVVGEILAGILVGPSVLALVSYTELVESIAHIGAIILLFVVGLECKFKEVYNVKNGMTALAGVVLPWIGGYAVALLFGHSNLSAVFMGTALTATSIAITAQVLKEMKKLDTAPAKAIIGAAVIDDVLALIALSITIQLASGEMEYHSILYSAVKAFGLLIAGSMLGNLVISRGLEKLDEQKTAKIYPEITFIAAMTVAFFYSMLAEVAGLSAIVGAFIAGVSLESANLRHSFKEGAEYLRIIFASIFFISLGVIADLRVLNMSMLSFVAALTLVAIITKIAGCYFPAKLQGMSRNDALTVGFGMSPRGEVAMITALIGLTNGLIDQEVYTSIILMSLITTLIAPVTLKKFYQPE